MSLVDAALAAASMGWHVFPCEAGGKRPRPRWRWQEWNTTDPGRIRQWWADGGWNVGIATGPSRLVVVDLDTPEGPMPPPWDQIPGITDGSDIFAALCEQHGEPWPDTYTVTTPSKGRHFYYRADNHHIRNSARKIAPLIDVRSMGGFVIGAGSHRPDGAYKLVNDHEPVSLPGWLAALMAAAAPEPAATRPARVHGGAYARAALAREADTVASSPAGQRNDTLNRSAWAVSRFAAAGDLDAAEIAATLTAAALSAGLAPDETRRTIASALRARHA